LLPCPAKPAGGIGRSGQDCSVLVIGHCFSIPAPSDSHESSPRRHVDNHSGSACGPVTGNTCSAPP
jgi:hypothetical protein